MNFSIIIKLLNLYYKVNPQALKYTKFYFNSQAVLVDRTLYLSGVIGMDIESQKLVEGGVVAETRQVFRNMGHILKEAGSNYDKGHSHLKNIYYTKRNVECISFNSKLVES